MKPRISLRHAFVCLTMSLLVTPALALARTDSNEGAHEDCHSSFAVYLAAEPYIINPAVADRASTTIVAMFDDESLESDKRMPYRLEVVDTTANRVVFASTSETTLSKDASPIERVFNWAGVDQAGKPVVDGEYSIRMIARALDPTAKKYGGELEASRRAGGFAEGSAVHVVVDRAGRYDELFTSADKTRGESALRSSLDASFPYQFVYGSTHAHTNWSDGGMPVTSCTSGHYGYAGGAQPINAYEYAKTTGGLDYLAVVEHNHLMQEACAGCSSAAVLSRYVSGFAQAQSSTVPGQFVGLFGMEWGVISNGGHINIYNTDKLMSWTGEPYHVLTPKSVYPDVYTAMKNNQGALGCYGTFNHPESSDYGNYTRTADGDAVMRGLSIVSGPAFSTSTTFTPGGSTYKSRYDQALGVGWKIGPETHQDNHCQNYGTSTPNRTGALIPNGTTFDQASLMAAYGSRRIFAVQDRDAQLVYRTSDSTRVMGDSFSASAGVSVTASLLDPAGEGVQKIEIWGGKRGTNATPGAAAAIETSNTGANTLTATLSPKTAGEEWYYYVVAVQADGNTAWSAPMWITWGASCSAPAAATQTSPANGATGIGTSTTLSWSAVSGATSYDVYFGTSTSPAFFQNTTSTSLPVSSLAAGTTYYWNVVAKNSCGAGPSSGTRNFATQAACSAPAAPVQSSPANGATGVATSTTLSWGTVSGATSYDVYFGTSSSPAFYQNTTSASIAVSGLSAGTTYYWNVVAKNSCGSSPSSGTRNFATQAACSAPAAPVQSSPANGATGVSTSTTLSWGAVSGATSYDVYFGTSSSPAFHQNTTGTSLPVSALAAGTTYYWRVVAKNTCGSSPSSSTRSFVTATTQVTLLNEGAESGATGWSMTVNSGSGWSIQASDPFSGTKRFKTNAAYTTYLDNVDWRLTSPTFSLAGRASASLKYYFKHDTESGYDYLRVEVSTNGGSTWTQLQQRSGLSSGYSAWAPQATVDLTPYVGSSTVKIRFRFTSDGSITDWGVALDDILVTAQ